MQSNVLADGSKTARSSATRANWATASTSSEKGRSN